MRFAQSVLFAFILTSAAHATELRLVAGASFDSASSNNGEAISKTTYSVGGHAIFDWFRTGLLVSRKNIVTDDSALSRDIQFTMLQVPLTYRFEPARDFGIYVGALLGILTGTQCTTDPKPGVTLTSDERDDCGSSFLPMLTGGLDYFFNEQVGFEAGVNWIGASGDTFTNIFAHMLVRFDLAPRKESRTPPKAGTIRKDQTAM